LVPHFPKINLHALPNIVAGRDIELCCNHDRPLSLATRDYDTTQKPHLLDEGIGCYLRISIWLVPAHLPEHGSTIVQLFSS